MPRPVYHFYFFYFFPNIIRCYTAWPEFEFGVDFFTVMKAPFCHGLHRFSYKSARIREIHGGDFDELQT